MIQDEDFCQCGPIYFRLLRAKFDIDCRTVVARSVMPSNGEADSQRKQKLQETPNE